MANLPLERVTETPYCTVDMFGLFLIRKVTHSLKHLELCKHVWLAVLSRLK